MSGPSATPVGLRLHPHATLALTLRAAVDLVDALEHGGRHIRLAEGAHLVIDDTRAALAISALRAQIADEDARG